jgi:hypothetical protein
MDTLGITTVSDKLEQIVASYFSELRDKRGLGAGTPERSYYPAVARLLDAIGEQLKPKVLCLSDLSDTGAGQPDFGLYVANQVQRGGAAQGTGAGAWRHRNEARPGRCMADG